MTSRTFSLLLLGISFLVGPVLAQDEPTVEESFSDRVEVTIVELMIDPHDKKGNPVLGLTADDFLVWEDGEPVEVIGLDYPSSRSAIQNRPTASPSSAPTPSSASTPTASALTQKTGTADWRFLVYFDGPLTGSRSIRRSIEGIESRLEELVQKGPIEVVMANPEPRLVQSFTRDPGAIRRALQEVRKEPSQNILMDERRSFMRLLDTRLSEGNGPTVESATRALEGPIRSAVQREYALVDRRIREFSEWMAAYGDVPASAAIIVTDGFDMEPAEFYTSSTSASLDQRLRIELQEYRVETLVDGLGRQLAATGWTTMVLTMGGGSAAPVASEASTAQRDRFRSIGAIGTAGPGSVSNNSVVSYALEPLMMVAEQTGGEVVTTRKKAGPAIERLAERPRLIYRAPRARDGKVHEVRVKSKREGVQLRSTNWVRSPTGEQVMASRARRLLVLDSDAGEMPVRLDFPSVGPKKSGGARTISAEVSFDLNLIKGAIQASQVPLYLTFGIEIPNRPPFVHRVEQSFNLPTDGGSWPELLYQTIIEVPAETERLSIVVEEPSSGVWGGAVAEL